MKKLTYKTMFAVLLSMWLMVSVISFAKESALPDKPQDKSATIQSVQPQVNKQTTDEAAAKRTKLLEDATAAIAETKVALKALEEKKTDDVLNALSTVTGKLELIIARDPKLSLAPIDTEVVALDLLSNVDTIKAVIREAKRYLDDGEIQKARPLIANLASEIDHNTINIPLSTYPAAIKAITPLIDAGKIDEAKAGLLAALNTLVVTKEIIPLPKLRAEQLIKEAQTLSEKKGRTDEDNKKLSNQLTEAQNQLKIAELLGYGKKSAFDAIYKQIEELQKKTAGSNSGVGWFEKIKKQLSDLW